MQLGIFPEVEGTIGVNFAAYVMCVCVHQLKLGDDVPGSGTKNRRVCCLAYVLIIKFCVSISTE